ncbi:hypothetical protein OUHCRE3_57730 [Enterobacter hormaechei]
MDAQAAARLGDEIAHGFGVAAMVAGAVAGALIGAAVVVLLAVLSKTRNYYIAGLVPLFPTFALIAHYIVGKGRSLDDLKTTIVFGMWSIIPYFVYLAALYLLVERFRLETSLALAALAWLVAASVLVGLWVRLHA